MRHKLSTVLTRCFAIVLLLLGWSLAATEAKEASLANLANPLQGTDSIFAFSHGNLYPAIATPFPMNAWAPYTQPMPDSFYYQYRQHTFRGIRQTHQPSPWINDYAAFSFMPVSGELRVRDTERGSQFSHEGEYARPYYYRVHLDTYGITFEVTPTERCARFRVSYETRDPAYLVLDSFPKGSSVQLFPDEQKIVGITRFRSGGTPDNFANYFVVYFDQPWKSYGTWTPDKVSRGEEAAEGEHVGAYLEFDVQQNSTITYRVGSSFISPEQAEQNLKNEIGDSSFEQIRSKAEAQWNTKLGRIQIEGGTAEQRRTFYSAFYRCLLFPHKFYEIDSEGKQIYYSPYDGELHEGVLYTDSGLWDTFRAVHPFFNLVFPEVNAEILQGLLNAYDQSGWLPAWASPGHRGCMIGNHSFSLFADAWVKGNRSFDARHALAAMIHDSQNEGPIGSIGRDGVGYYRELGYLPSPEIREATAKTLEFAYDDYCASVVAEAVGNEDAQKEFLKSSQNWKNVFDADLGFVRGRKLDGSWVEHFHPDEWGGPFTEGCSWHWTWCVFHDMDGLIEAMGGREAFTDKLDELFDVPPTVRTGSYGGLIHEMTEMIAINKGQYAHGNQPIQHMIYLYDYAGQPWKAQAKAREVMQDLYNSSAKGFCGDEDNGQTSAWYLFSAMGFYPVTPGQPVYALGSPLFERTTIQLPQGKKFTIQATDNGPGQYYVQSAHLDSQAIDRIWLLHREIVDGGELTLEMDDTPNKQWASAPDASPSKYQQADLIKEQPADSP